MTGANVFVNNSATTDGGGIGLENSTLLITDSNHKMTQEILNSYALSNALSLKAGTIHFVNNTAKSHGGAISVSASSKLLVSLTRTTMTFEYNLAGYKGGAIFIVSSQATVTATSQNLKFISNTAIIGGAIGIFCANAAISATAGHNITFTANTVSNGGAIGVDSCASDLTLANCIFSRNRASAHGGAISSYGNPTITMKGVMQFINNSAEYGGAWAGLKSSGDTSMWIVKDDASDEPSSPSLSQTAAGVKSHSMETVVFINNSANEGGGAIYLDGIKSWAIFKANIHFRHNKAKALHCSGGAIMIDSHGGTLQVQGQSTSFVNNTGHRGGAICLRAGEVYFEDNARFSSNTAYEGGAMYFSEYSSIYVHSNIATSDNFAQSRGGFMYHKDNPTPEQCMTKTDNFYDHHQLPSCFIQFQMLAKKLIVSYNDTAGDNGGFLYGGLLDKCQLTSYSDALP